MRSLLKLEFRALNETSPVLRSAALKDIKTTSCCCSLAQAEYVPGSGLLDGRLQDVRVPTDHRLLPIREAVHVQSGMR